MKYPSNNSLSASASSSSSSSSSSSKPLRNRFDHENLDVYQLELQFIAWVTPLLANLNPPPGVKVAEVTDQLDRASLSALLKTAEGNGKRQRHVRAKFFDDARGSATECAGCLDALVAKGVCAVKEIEEGKQLLLRIVSMLCKLVDLFDGAQGLREDEVEYRVEPESRTRTTTRTRTN